MFLYRKKKRKKKLGEQELNTGYFYFSICIKGKCMLVHCCLTAYKNIVRYLKTPAIENLSSNKTAWPVSLL